MRTKEYYREYRLRNKSNTIHAKLDKILAILQPVAENAEPEPTKASEAVKPKKAVQVPKTVKDPPQPITDREDYALNVCVHCNVKASRQSYLNGAIVWVCQEHV